MDRSVAIYISGVRRRSQTRIEIIIVDRKGANIMWKADRESSRRVIITEKDVGKCISSLFRLIELLNKTSSAVSNPRLGDRLARGEDHDSRNTRPSYSPYEVSLRPNEVYAVDVHVFTSSSI